MIKEDDFLNPFTEILSDDEHSKIVDGLGPPQLIFSLDNYWIKEEYKKGTRSPGRYFKSKLWKFKIAWEMNNPIKFIHNEIANGKNSSDCQIYLLLNRNFVNEPIRALTCQCELCVKFNNKCRFMWLISRKLLIMNSLW